MAKMFSAREEDMPVSHSAASPQTVIGQGIKVEGAFSGSGNVIVQGEVEGTLSTAGDLVIENGAIVHANLEAQNIRVSGEVKGDITCHGQLELNSTAKIYGDVTTDIISVDTGAVIQGQCRTGVSSTAAPAAPEVAEESSDDEE